ncbi:MAG: lipoate--protein ligase family protein [Actinomycetota bacterium]|nr:lipoate--protein ligase family protein [Actinomycetota bacterium]
MRDEAMPTATRPGSGAGDTLTVLRQSGSLGAAADLDFGLSLLARARAGELGPTIRLYRPRPTLAFGQRDTNLPGFGDARDAAVRHGFEPLVRKAGGRAAAYHRGCLVIDHVEPQQDAMIRSKARFGYFGELLAGALRGLGVDAAVGEIPREYCPGEFTVHGNVPGGRQIKLVGTAQRVVAGAWLFSSVIIVQDAAPLRAVLTDCYAALGLEWDPGTAGGVSDISPAIDVAAVEAAVLRAYAGRANLVPMDLSTTAAP